MSGGRINHEKRKRFETGHAARVARMDERPVGTGSNPPTAKQLEWMAELSEQTGMPLPTGPQSRTSASRWIAKARAKGMMG